MNNKQNNILPWTTEKLELPWKINKTELPWTINKTTMNKNNKQNRTTMHN